MCLPDKLQFPQIVEMLIDPNVIISDTGDSVYSTEHIHILINSMKPEKGDSVTLPDGTKTATKIISDLRETVCDKQGNGLTNCVLSRVRYSSRKKFSLFSATKRLMNWWDLGGYGNSIWIRKNEKNNFDIKIKAKGGIIFAMYVNREFTTQEVAAAGADFRMKVNINKVRELLGYMN